MIDTLRGNAADGSPERINPSRLGERRTIQS